MRSASSALSKPRRRSSRRATRAILAMGLAAGLGLVAGPDAVGASPHASAALAAAVAVNDCWSRDNGDPDLQTFRVTPSSVDVTNGPATVKFLVRAVDTGGPVVGTGIRSVRVDFGPYSLFSQPLALTKNRAGNWVGRVSIPRWSPDGTWSAWSVTITDRAGNQGFWDVDALVALGFPDSVQVTSTVDNQGPRLAAFSIKPDSVDTRTHVKHIGFTVRANDPLSGVDRVFVVARNPTTSTFADARLRKVAGTPGTYRGSTVIPTWQGNSTWYIESVQLIDHANNVRFVSGQDLATRGLDHGFAVVSRKDTFHPVITDFGRTPSILDLRVKDGTLSIRLRAQDKGAGVDSVEVDFGTPAVLGGILNLHRASGTASDGIWVGKVVVSRCQAVGHKWLLSVLLRDGSGNPWGYLSKVLLNHGWPGTVAVRDSDHQPPTAEAPVAAVPVSADVTFTFNEDVSGIDAQSATMFLDPYAPNPTVVPGTWTCTTASDQATDCATGTVRKATFDPTADLVGGSAQYAVEFNPEHNLSVTDLAGNPVDRYYVDFFTE